MSVVYFLIFWVRGLFRLIQYNAVKRSVIELNETHNEPHHTDPDASFPSIKN